jgi:16S rRNA processing protein RimM
VTTPQDTNLTSGIVVVGQLASPYGVQGWLKVHSLTNPKENIFNYTPWQFYLNNQWVLLKIKAHRFTSHPPIIQLEDCLTPEDAKRYTGINIGVNKSQLPQLPMGKYYWAELIGLHVTTTDGTPLGKVDHLMETGSNDVLVVIGLKKHLIPYLPNQVVLQINLAEQSIVVDWDPEF